MIRSAMPNSYQINNQTIPQPMNETQTPLIKLFSGYSTRANYFFHSIYPISFLLLLYQHLLKMSNLSKLAYLGHVLLIYEE